MPPRSRSLHVAGGATEPGLPPVAAPAVPLETAPPAPDILAALESGDDAAVWAWVRAQVPDTNSLIFYGLLVGVGVAGLVEWPALALSAFGQWAVDQRFGGVEQLASELRVRFDAMTAPAPAV